MQNIFGCGGACVACNKGLCCGLFIVGGKKCEKQNAQQLLLSVWARDNVLIILCIN